MTSIYTTKDSLEAICLEEEKRAWLDIIIKLKEVYINDLDVFEDGVDPEDDPFYILDQMEIDIKTDKKDYIDTIPNDPKSVLENPSGIFLLDIPINQAESIQKDFGVICQSVFKMDFSMLTQPHYPTELDEGETNRSWKNMISRYKAIPSNSLLVVDAHLFENDRYDEKLGIYDQYHRDGITNLFEILDCILPSVFQGIYHVGILITDIDIAKSLRRSRTNLTNDRIATAINKLKKELRRDYIINIEVLFFDSRDNDGHKLIHNRRILSNYFIVTADHKLATLRKGKCLCSQTIIAFPLFENIDNDPDSDKKEKRIRNELNKFHLFIERQKKIKDHTAKLYLNGKVQMDFSNLTHRLLNF